jgi:hypothetical protein
MFRRVLIILILSLLISSCGGAAPAPTEEPAPAPTDEVAGEPTVQPVLPENTPTAEPTSTLEPTPTIVLPTPTDTPLPPLELPTEIPNAPSLLAWDGTPTYLGDSQPGYDFRVYYNPEIWALTQDQFGFPALGHRGIPYCVISVTSGRGLPPNITVEQDILYTDKLTFYVGTAFENGVKKFVTYTGGNGTIITGFEVSFKEQVDECIADAEAVIKTLQAIPSSRATPEP